MSFIGRLPPDPLKENDTNVEDMAKFVLEFKDLMTAECFEKIDAENQERDRVKSLGKGKKIVIYQYGKRLIC